MPSYFIFKKIMERESDYDNDGLDPSEEYFKSWNNDNPISRIKKKTEVSIYFNKNESIRRKIILDI